MSVSVLEIGNFNDSPDTTRIFYTEMGAVNQIPYGFKKIDNAMGIYYEDEIDERWLTIKTYRVEV